MRGRNKDNKEKYMMYLKLLTSDFVVVDFKESYFPICNKQRTAYIYARSFCSHVNMLHIPKKCNLTRGVVSLCPTLYILAVSQLRVTETSDHTTVPVILQHKKKHLFQPLSICLSRCAHVLV